jgi:hypothetical protein
MTSENGNEVPLKKILNDKPSKLKKQEVLDLFGNKENYIQYHSEWRKLKIESKYVLGR